jgi:hypothetical protein
MLLKMMEDKEVAWKKANVIKPEVTYVTVDEAITMGVIVDGFVKSYSYPTIWRVEPQHAYICRSVDSQGRLQQFPVSQTDFDNSYASE